MRSFYIQNFEAKLNLIQNLNFYCQSHRSLYSLLISFSLKINTPYPIYAIYMTQNRELCLDFLYQLTMLINGTYNGVVNNDDY